MKKWIKTVLIIFGILILLFILLMIFSFLRAVFRPLPQEDHCEPVNLVCITKEETVSKDKIPCSSDAECEGIFPKEYCGQDSPNFHKYANERNYCGEDGFCKQCPNIS